MLALNTPQGFTEVVDPAFQFKTGRVRPVFADLDGDGRLDLFVPQEGICRVFANRAGKLTDITAQSGVLAQPVGHAVGAAVADFDGDGKMDVIIGCLKGVNRCFRNNGQGQFVDATETLGLSQQIFNTRGLAAADNNQDGAADLLLNNEGQESTVLLGRPSAKALVSQVGAKP